jgi:flagellar biosynthesis protein FlgN
MPSTSPLSRLQDELQAMQALLDLTREEQPLLIDAEIDQLAALTPRKTALVGQLAQCAAARHAQLAAAGFPASEAGMAAWLAAPGNEDGGALWSALLACTRQAKELNRVNGMLVNKHMAHARAALDALRPPTQTNHTTYGPSGQTSNAPTSRKLVIG